MSDLHQSIETSEKKKTLFNLWIELMSLKKDNFKSSDKKIMNFAINLAENNKYLTGTNPSVGCVIVKNNKILSFATTNNGGRPHAESIALNKNRYNKGTSLYSTLEPCSHHGLTPPCTNAIIKNKVKRVYYLSLIHI